MAERSVTDHLYDLGVTHQHDAWSITDGKHELFYAGRFIGRYSAHDVSLLLKEHGLTDDPAAELLDALKAIVIAHGGMQCSYPIRRAVELIDRYAVSLTNRTRGMDMNEGLKYILELLEAEEIEDDDFVRQARSIGIGDFELAQVLVDEYSDEACRVPNLNTTLWRRRFYADAPFNSRKTGWYESKTLAFDAALLAVAYRFGLSLPVGSGRCREVA